MMTFTDNGSLQVMPCVELNLRTTMGLLSSKLGDRILAPGRIGEMTITCRQTYDAVISYVKSLAPAQVEKTAHTFAAELLAAKFVQGLPVIGILGGAANPVYYQKIMRYVQLKYRKRYLLRKKR